MRRDPVTSDVYDAIMHRDGWRCVAPIVDVHAGMCGGRLTLDHVKDQPRMGVRAPSDPDHLVTLCERHHLHTHWATSHRPDLRAYLRSFS